MILGHAFKDLLAVLSLFVIPIGGGIPAGVILAKTRGIEWQVTTLLYFISDLILACTFEPLMLLFIHYAKDKPAYAKFLEAYRTSLERTGFKYGLSPSWFSLVVLSFGVDPMTGRVVARGAGHGFITGWMIAITGDMIFFAIIAISTLTLNNILGDGTWAAVIVIAGMILVPALIRRFKERFITKQ